jgi:hemerythrin superfamily protein
MPDIFEILKSDHDEHRRMLEELATASTDARADLFEAFRVEVSAHAAAEEQSLYASMLGDPELQEDGRHSVAEHKEIDDLLGELQEMAADDADWPAKFGAMRHRYTHHIDEEEEEMFPAAEKHFSAEKAAELGAKFDRRKPRELEHAAESESGSGKE